MLVAEADKAALKEWIIPRLRQLTDLDIDAPILAEYIVAVLEEQQSEEVARKNAVTELSDFLLDHTEAVVDAVLQDIRTKAFLPQAPPPNPPTGPKTLPSRGNFEGNGTVRPSRKRSYLMRETSQERDSHHSHDARNTAGERPPKQTARRGGQNSRGGLGGSGMNASARLEPNSFMTGLNARAPVFTPQISTFTAPFASLPTLPPAFTPPPALPSGTPDPMTLFAMAVAINMGMPSLPPAFLPPGNPLAAPSSTATDRTRIGHKERCSEYDHKGICMRGTLCPYEHGEEAVLATSPLINAFDPTSTSPSHQSSNTASSSAVPHKSYYDEDMDMLDAETIAQRQYEAQLAFNERQKKRKECAAKKAEIDAQLKPLEIQLNLLKADIEVMEGGKTPEAGRAVQTRSDVLTRRLLELQEEGRRMMAEQADLATPAAFSPYSSSRSRGHGSYRGRSSYRARGYRVPRGRGYSAVRGGRYRGGGVRSSVRRLDNRPKSVLIGGFKAGSTQDEALRQHLFSKDYDHDGIEPYPGLEDAQVIGFKERYQAELFVEESSKIPGIGKIKLAWVPSSRQLSSSHDAATMADPDQEDQSPEDDDNLSSGAVVYTTNLSDNGLHGEADYDVADVEDRWRDLK